MHLSDVHDENARVDRTVCYVYRRFVFDVDWHRVEYPRPIGHYAYFLSAIRVKLGTESDRGAIYNRHACPFRAYPGGYSAAFVPEVAIHAAGDGLPVRLLY